MDCSTFRKFGALGLLLCAAMLSSAACTPEQQLLLTAADKIISELEGDDKTDNESTAEGAAVPAPESGDSP